MITPHDAIREDDSLLRDLLESARIPIVLVERSVEERTAGRLEWVRSDHVYGAEMAVRHLAGSGASAHRARRQASGDRSEPA